MLEDDVRVRACSRAVAAYRTRLAEQSDIQGHLEFMHELVSGYIAPAVVELGVRAGYSTSALLAAVHRKAGMLWSVDIKEALVPLEWYRDERWEFRQGDDLDPQVQAWLPPGCTVLFIDTSHDYDHTLAELRLYAPRVVPGGTILLHDTHWDKDNVELTTPTGPVALAIIDYCEETGLEWTDRPGSYGLGVIRV